jgi:hypothetical protein
MTVKLTKREKLKLKKENTYIPLHAGKSSALLMLMDASP